MKKTILFSALGLLFILLGIGFKKKQVDNTLAKSIKEKAIECFPNNNPETNFIDFVPDPSLNTIERKEFNTLSKEEIENINYAINKMKAISRTNPNDPTGWVFQTKIHNGPLTLAEQSWGTCEHGSCMFLAWHRMYLYFFEKILRSKMDPKKSMPALPFWDYELSNGNSLPKQFKINKATNAFFDDNRVDFANLNPGRLYSIANIKNDFKIAFKQTNFYKFQHDLENAHGKVHYAIGKIGNNKMLGDMNDLKKAASDPIFFLHHSNIDRLWEKWLNTTNVGDKFSHCNPNKILVPEWGNKKFYFYDEKGRSIAITASQITDIRGQLNYKYENINAPNLSATNCNDSICPNFSKPKAKIASSKLALSNSASNYNFSSSNSFSEIEALIKAIKNAPLNFKNIKENVYLEFSDIDVNKYPKGVIEIYLQVDGALPFSTSKKTYIGILDLFTANAIKLHGGMHGEGNTLRVNITNAIKELKINITAFKKIKILFQETSNETGAINELLNADTDISIGKLALAIY